FKFRFKFRETLGMVESGQIVEAVGERRPAGLLDFQPRKSGGPVARTFAELAERHLASRKSQHRTLRRHHALAARDEIVQRRNQLALGEVARRAEDHHRAWRRRLGSLYGQQIVHVAAAFLTCLRGASLTDKCDTFSIFMKKPTFRNAAMHTVSTLAPVS